MPTCNSCGELFDDFYSLALHINKSKTGHKNGKRWAANFLLKNSLPAKFKYPNKVRVPLSEDDKETLRNNHRELSGTTKLVNVFCLKCKRLYPRVIEIEYIESEHAQRRNGTLIITCNNCESRNGRNAFVHRQYQDG